MAFWDQSNPISPAMFEALRERAAGENYQFTVLRYISRYTRSWKVITDVEWQHLADFHGEMAKHGGYCLVGLIYEDNGTPRGSGQGASDAVVTREWISRLNVPVGGLIAYTDDEDGPVGSVLNATEAYFGGLKTSDGHFIPTRGLYASGTVVNAAKHRGLIDVRWITQSMGFSGSHADIAAGEYEIKQLLNVPYAGQDIDPNVLRSGLKPWDVGCFVPGGGLYSPAVA
jgi:hypothetical protein